MAGEWFSVHCFQDSATTTPLRWYVNFEYPYRRRPGFGIDTMDLALDLVITPDLTGHHWKDTEEYGKLRRLGVVDEYAGREIERARGRGIGMLDDRARPFAGGRPTWAPDPSWPLPTLPPGADEAATSATAYRP
ncbi:DUF402 domain-containing protein [Kitasatospora sp. NPDC048540]|uniref:DUF402 domain-containing protein n=1 Tax=Kitasatospora sp. NPDC048540 TaxID=3155634 RepID=UPI0033D97E50